MTAALRQSETEVEYECRVMIVGYSGSGKSSLGNKLIGKTSVDAVTSDGNLLEGDQPRAGFMVSRGCDSATRKSQYQTGRLQMAGQTINLKVVDTPGLFDPTDEDLIQAKVEILRGLSLCCPGGPHAVLFLVPFGRFTEQEDKAFEEVLKLLENVKDHLVVVFTHGENLGPVNIEDVLARSQVKGLRRMIKTVRNRYVVSTNVPDLWGSEVESLMDKVLQVSDGCCKYYPVQQPYDIDGKIQKLMRERGKSREEAVQEVGRQEFREEEDKKKVDKDKEQNWELLAVLVVGVVVGVIGMCMRR